MSIATRDAVRSLAVEDGLTLDEEIRRLTRAERQRRIGTALSEPPSTDDEGWLEMAAAEIGDDAVG